MKPLGTWSLGGKWVCWWVADLSSDPLGKLFLSKALYLGCRTRCQWLCSEEDDLEGNQTPPPCPFATQATAHKFTVKSSVNRKWHCTAPVYFSGILHFLGGIFVCLFSVRRAFFFFFVDWRAFFSLWRKWNISGFKTILSTFMDVLQLTEYYPPWLYCHLCKLTTHMSMFSVV